MSWSLHGLPPIAWAQHIETILGDWIAARRSDSEFVGHLHKIQNTEARTKKYCNSSVSRGKVSFLHFYLITKDFIELVLLNPF